MSLRSTFFGRGSDEERAYPALRDAQTPGAPDRTAAPRPDLDVQTADAAYEVLYMHGQVNRIVEVILADMDAAVRDLPVLEPNVRKKIANWIDRRDPENGAVIKTDVDGPTNPFCIRYASVRWPESPADVKDAYETFFKAWRTACFKAGRVHEAMDEGTNWTTVNEKAVGWCLGPGDKIIVQLESSEDLFTVSCTRAFVPAEERAQCT